MWLEVLPVGFVVVVALCAEVVCGDMRPLCLVSDFVKGSCDCSGSCVRCSVVDKKHIEFVLLSLRGKRSTRRPDLPLDVWLLSVCGTSSRELEGGEEVL